MENQSVVERFLFLLAGLFVGEFFCAFGKPDEIRNRRGRLVFKQAHHNVSLGSLKSSVGSCRSAHAFSFCARLSYPTLTLPRHFPLSPALSLSNFLDIPRIS